MTHDMSRSSTKHSSENATVVRTMPPSAKMFSPSKKNASRTSNGMSVSSFSSKASQAISKGKYIDALNFYQRALDDYLRGSTTVVELVNAAATCFNLGALSKKLQNFSEASMYYDQAEKLYKNCFQKVFLQEYQVDNESTTSSSCKVCLIQLIVETLQARAHLHYKYQHLLEEAIQCHEEVVEILEQNSAYKQETSLVRFRIHFETLAQEEHWELLITSLQFLGKFYVEKSDFEDGLMAYHEVLKILQKNDVNAIQTKRRVEETKQIIKALSKIHKTKNHTNVIEAPDFERLARAQEEMENWDNALLYWEQFLLHQSQKFGEESSEVTAVLCQLARVMTEQGNKEGALDLYQAACMKYQKAKILIPNDLITNTLEVFQQLGQPLEGIAWLEELSLQSDSETEMAWIHYELGRLYLDQGQLYESSSALCKSAEISEGDDEHVFKLLQRVEFLQNRLDLDTPTIASSLGLDAINEDDEHSVQTDELIGSLGIEPADYGEEKKVDFDEVSDPIADDNEVFDINESSYDNEVVDDVSWNNKSSEMSQVKHILNLTNSMTNNKAANVSGEILDISNDSGIGVEEGDDNKSSRSLSPIPFDEVTDSLLMSVPGFGPSPFEYEEPGLESVKVEDEDENDDDEEEEESEEAFSKALSSMLASTSELGAMAEASAKEAAIAMEARKSSHETTDATSFNDHVDSKSEPSGPKVDADAVDSLDSALRTSSNHSGAESILDKEASPVENPFPIFFEKSDSPTHSPVPSSDSRTRLLKSSDKAKSPSHAKGLRIPSLASPKNASAPKSPKSTPKNPIVRIKQEYEEVKQNSKAAPRRSLVKALASPFKRTRHKRAGSGLHALDEGKIVKSNMPNPSSNVFDDDLTACDAPVSYIFDDDQSQISQITFREDYSSKRSRRRRSHDHQGQWWWGVTSEGLEGWFPSEYVNQAVQAAEGFLSAKEIHDQANPRPLDFDSEDESEVEGDLEDSLFDDEEEAGQAVPKPELLSSQARNVSDGSSAARPSMTERSNSAGIDTSGHSSKKQTLDSQIQEKEELLETKILENGPENIAVAGILFDLAGLNNKNNDIAQALDNTQRALKIQKSTLNLSDACKSLHFMADLHLRQRQYQTALKCYEESQKLQEAVFGYFHEETANTLNRIGNVFARQGEFGLAMENHKEALRILKECCGEEVKNPLVSQTLIQIGAVYYRERNSLSTIQSNVDGYATFIEGGMLEVIGRAHEERGSYRMALAFFEEKLQFLNEKEDSDDIEHVAETLNSLGMLSCRAGLYLEAIDYYDRALSIQMKLGCDEVQLAMARVLAGSVQFSLGQYKKALKLFEDALDTLQRQVGTEQETVAATLFHMGVVRMILCEYDDAMSDFRDALDIQNKLLGNDHPATLRTRREMTNILSIYESELATARQDFNDILEIQKRIHGEKHPNVAETLQSIGITQAKSGDHAKALQTLEDCYNMRLEFLGMDHPLQATALHEIAKLQFKRGRIKKSIHICEAAINIRVESLGDHHIDVAMAMSTKAGCLVAQNKFVEANKLFQEALKISEEAVGSVHPSVASIYEQIGTMHLRQCHFEEASEAIQKALTIYRESNLDDDHPGIQGTLKELERVERAEMLCV